MGRSISRHDSRPSRCQQTQPKEVIAALEQRRIQGRKPKARLDRPQGLTSPDVSYCSADRESPIDSGRQHQFGLGSDDALHHVAAVKNHQGGNASGIELRRCSGESSTLTATTLSCPAYSWKVARGSARHHPTRATTAPTGQDHHRRCIERTGDRRVICRDQPRQVRLTFGAPWFARCRTGVRFLVPHDGHTAIPVSAMSPVCAYSGSV